MPLKDYYEDYKDEIDAKTLPSDFEPVIEPQDAFEAFDSAFRFTANDTSSSFQSAKEESEKSLDEQFIKIVGKSADDIIQENDGGFVTNVKENIYGFVDHDYKINRALELIGDDGKYRGQLTDFNIPYYKRIAKIQQERDKAQQDTQYTSLSTTSQFGTFLGSASRIMLDPVNLLTMFVPGGGVTKLGRIGYAALTEAGVQAVQEPAIQLSRAQADLEYGVGRASENILTAGIGGAAFQGVGEIIGIAGRKIFKPKDNIFAPQTEQDIININDQASTSIATTNSNLEKIQQAQNGLPVSSHPFNPQGFNANPVNSDINGKKIQTITDNPVNIRLKANETIPAKMMLVEADDLITSNLDDGVVNDLYPPDLQPRDRSSLASQIQVNDIAQDIDPDLLINGSSAAHGTPIIGDDFIVDSGNGRVMALRRAMNNYPDSYNNYKQALIDNGYDLAGFKNPVLVRMRTEAMDTPSRIKFNQTANKSAVAKMSVSEQAFMDKNAIDDDMLNLYAGGDISSSQNKHFIRSFVDKNVSANDTSDFITKGGQLSQNGKTRIEAALLAKALNNKKIVADYFETTDPDLKSVLGALSDAAPHLSRIAGHKHHNLSENIIGAIDILKKSRSDKTNISDLINQIDLERGEISPLTIEILRAMHRNDSFKKLAGREKIADTLSDYARRIIENDFDGTDLLGQKLSPIDHLKGAIAASRGEKAPQIPLKEFTDKNTTIDIQEDIFKKSFNDATEIINENPDLSVPIKGTEITNGIEKEIDVMVSAKEYFDELADDDKSLSEITKCILG